MKPRIAWLTYDLPYPPNSGGKLRAYNLLKHLADDFEISLYSFYRQPPQLKNLGDLPQIVSTLKTYQRRPVWGLKNLIRNTYSALPLLNLSYLNSQLRRDLLTAAAQGRYALVHFEFLGVANLLTEVRRQGRKTVFGEENIEYRIYREYSLRSKLWLMKPLYFYDVWKMKRFEEKLWRASDLNLAVSTSDAAVVEKETGRFPVVVPNGVDLPAGTKGVGPVPGPTPKSTAFFSGDLNYQQNRNGLEWFLSEVLPEIKREVPDFKVLVLSRVRPRFINKYQSDVEMVVDSESPFEKFVDSVSLFISPVTIKSGTNIKVLQAAANHLPTVGTPESFVGYDFEDEKDVLIARDSRDFAQKIVRLLKDGEWRRRLAGAAFTKVQGYSWDNSAKILRDAYFSLLS